MNTAPEQSPIKPTRTQRKLLRQHLRAREKGGALYDRSSEALDAAIVAGVPIGTPMQLDAETVVVVTDRAAKGNKIFHPTFFTRFKVEPVDLKKLKAKDAVPA